MDDNTKHLIASNLTAAFYNGIERREPYLGEERRANLFSPRDENRVPNLSLKEVYCVYRRFIEMLDAQPDEAAVSADKAERDAVSLM
jgi:hypothetical protein